jgi:hypothetical protein
MTHDLPPPDAASGSVDSYGEPCWTKKAVRAAIAPYKAEIERLKTDNVLLARNLRGKHSITGATYEHLAAENAKLRELLEQVAEETAPWTKTLMSTEWGKDCRAALGEKK